MLNIKILENNIESTESYFNPVHPYSIFQFIHTANASHMKPTTTAMPTDT